MKESQEQERTREQPEATVWSIMPVRGALESNALADVLEVVDAAQQADGARALSDQSLVMLRSGEAESVETLLAYAHAPGRISAREPSAEDGPRPETVIEHLAGVAVVTSDSEATLELAVHPHYRQQGLGRALVEAALSTVAHDGLADAGSLHAWAHGSLPAALHLAETSGFTAVRNLVKMERPADLPVPAEEALPVGMAMRAFDPRRDLSAWVRLNAEVFADHPEQGAITEADVRERMREPWFDAEDFLLVVDDADEIVAFNWLKRTADEAEIYAIGVSPSAQGLGLGTRLTAAGIRRLQSEGARAVALYTEGENTRAIHVYSGFGFEQTASDVMFARDAAETDAEGAPAELA
ncbi:mycothiol synthase [Arthrobacter sp. UM1]|uniref:mycothiol synthase n=1 Tax=Arthrobacter sp. UM1 TaxID=2766776 RepID=UPI001CF6CA6E|nr:mycothiol synthase [Arthrobacter sp. UM1]MCB4208326.1 mycothiol synthase [Arthrobacter sp. UM1]